MSVKFTAGLLVLLAAQGRANPLENLPDASTQSIDEIRKWADSLPGFGESQFSGVRQPSPEYWGDLSMYQVMPDRFNNGDGSNDNANLEQFQVNEMASGNLYNVHLYTHGGDLRGMIDRLDYLSWLGVDVLYPTAFNFNRAGQFHGYCVSNHLMVDPKFGNLADLQELVREAHKRNIMVIMDFVVNHLCDPSTSYVGGKPQGQDHLDCAWGLWNAENNPGTDKNQIRGRRNLQFSNNFFPPLRNQAFFSRCGAAKNFDAFGPTVYGDFVDSMFDLETSNRDVQHIMTQMAKYWIAAADIDGFRLDATKHVSDGYTAYFSTHVRDYALSLGKDNFYIIGETIAGYDWQARQLGPMREDLTQVTKNTIAELNPVFSKHPKQKFPGLTATYDLAHGGSAKDVFRGSQPTRSLEWTLNDESRKAITTRSDERTNWLVMDQHDWPRLLQGRDVRENALLVKAAYTYAHTAKGTPYVYYGTEQGFNADCYWNVIQVGNQEATKRIQDVCSGVKEVGGYDTLYRQTMWVDAGWNLGMADRSRAESLVRIGRPLFKQNPFSKDWQNDPFLAPNLISKEVRKLNAIRKSCPALRRGEMFFRWTDQDRGLLAYSRIYRSQEIIVVTNTRGSFIDLPTFTVDFNLAQKSLETQYVDLLNTDRVGWVAKENTRYRLEVTAAHRRLGPYESAIFVRKDFVGSWCDAIEAATCNDVAVTSDAGASSTLFVSGNPDVVAEEADDAAKALYAGIGGAVAGFVGSALVAFVYHRKTAKSSSF